MRAIAVILLFGSAAVSLAADLPLRNPDLPDPVLTPGALNPDVTQATIHRTICVPGWTATVRPSTIYTNALKRKHLPPGSDLASVEEDHLVSLVLGGHPRDPRNLWPQKWEGRWGAKVKDRLEGALARRVCSGRMSLDKSQDCIRANWIDCYKRIIGEAGLVREHIPDKQPN